MPYWHAGEKWFRVTEVTGVLDCQNVGYQIVHGDPKRARMANGVTLPGTFTHYKIAKHMAEETGSDLQPVPQLNEGTRKIIEAWRKQGIIQEELYDKANSGFANFLKFWAAYTITPVEIEKTMFWTVNIDGKEFRLGGTADLIGRVKMKGTTEFININDKQVLFFKECNHVQPDPMCQCELHDVVTIMDWKYSVNPQIPGHPMQLSTYWQGAYKLGILDRISHNGKFPLNYHTWSVLLRSKRKSDGTYEVDFRLHKYPYNELGDFFTGCRIMQDPKPITLTYRTGNMGVKFRCTFCAEPLNCPLNGVWFPDSAINVKIDESTSTIF